MCLPLLCYLLYGCDVIRVFTGVSDICLQVFRAYAQFWLLPLIDVIVSGVAGSDGLNYFIVELVVTLLSWHTVAIPQVCGFVCPHVIVKLP